LSAFNVSDLLWISTVLLSLFWWMQALAWSLPLPKVRSVVMLMMVVLHLLVWRMPQMRTMPFVRVAMANSGRLAGVRHAVRVDRAETDATREAGKAHPGFPRFGAACAWRGHGAAQKFGSAFGAQFWLEWRGRDGAPRRLGRIALLVFPVLLTGLSNGWEWTLLRRRRSKHMVILPVGLATRAFRAAGGPRWQSSIVSIQRVNCRFTSPFVP
jgi:hypothetical protein